MLIGTDHFSNYKKAKDYYSSQELSCEEISRRFQEGTFKLGKPEVKANQKLFLHVKEGRYYVEEGN